MRLRKLALKDAGMLVYRLPLSDNDTNVLAAGFRSAEEVDEAGEHFLDAEGEWSAMPDDTNCISLTRVRNANFHWAFDCPRHDPRVADPDRIEVVLPYGSLLYYHSDFRTSTVSVGSSTSLCWPMEASSCCPTRETRLAGSCQYI